MTDEQILQDLEAGKYKDAVKALYRFYPPVRQLILKNSGSRQDAEDIYQEALIILFRKVKEGKFSLSSSLSTFLYSICRFQWMHELRRRKKQPEKSLDEFTPQESEQFENYLEEEGKYRQAEQALRMLGEKCREILRLFYFDRMDLKAIASRVGFRNEKVVKTQKHRCLEKAREHYLSSNAKKD
jgi:RNA polymerase sigma factor (sigma-70 family)